MDVTFTVEAKLYHTSRTVYSLLDLLNDFGGMLSILLGLPAIFMEPYASHLYMLKAIQKLYKVDKKIDGMVEPGKESLNLQKTIRKFSRRFDKTS